MSYQIYEATCCGASPVFFTYCHGCSLQICVWSYHTDRADAERVKADIQAGGVEIENWVDIVKDDTATLLAAGDGIIDLSLKGANSADGSAAGAYVGTPSGLKLAPQVKLLHVPSMKGIGGQILYKDLIDNNCAAVIVSTKGPGGWMLVLMRHVIYAKVQQIY